MEIKDLAGLSEPLKRLIEVISQGVGSVTQPFLIRKVADARAYEIDKISTAISNAAEKHAAPVVYKDGEIEIWKKPDDQTLILDAKSPDERSALRIGYQERKRQNNIERITSTAAAEIHTEASVPANWPDEDWVTRFFNTAQNVSSAEMQDLWGRILAGEIRRPGMYSLRTLDFVANLSRLEAELLAKVGRFAFTSKTASLIPSEFLPWFESDRDVECEDFIKLAEIGILFPGTLNYSVYGDDNPDFLFGDRLISCEPPEPNWKVSLSAWKFTLVGHELLDLVPTPLDEEYIDKLAKEVAKQVNYEVDIGLVTKRLEGWEFECDPIRKVVN